MALKDITQIGKKLKHPKVRKWTYGKGEWGYYSWPGTKKRLQATQRMKSTEFRTKLWS